MPGMLYKPRDAAKLLGVTTETLRAWHREGTIHVEEPSSGRPKGHHRRYILPDGPLRQRPADGSIDVIYARVSSRKQQGDLERQIASLQSLHPRHRVISDIGSGLNFKRRCLLTLLDLAFQGRLKNVVVSHRDRLARFGFELFEFIFEKHGAMVTVLHPPDDNGTDGGELAEDLIAIVTVFAARHHGRQNGRSRRWQEGTVQVSKNTVLSNEEASADVQRFSRSVSVHLQQGERQSHPVDEGDGGSASRHARGDEVV